MQYNDRKNILCCIKSKIICFRALHEMVMSLNQVYIFAPFLFTARLHNS